MESGLDRNAIFLIVASFVILIGGVVFVSANNSAATKNDAGLSTDFSANPEEKIDQILGQKSNVDGLTDMQNSQNNTKPTPTPVAVTELQAQDLVVGTGLEATNGATVSVNYLGTLTNGQKFDSSYDRGVPFEFVLGAGEVIKGWDMGVLGMKIGGKRKLIIPSSLGYGERGARADIPPNATLVFEVELLDVK